MHEHEHESEYEQTTTGLRDQTVVLVPRAAGMDYNLSDLVDCRVFIQGRLGALRLHRLTRCTVSAAPVAGSVFFDDVTDCTVFLVARQIRIHHTCRTDLYVQVKSRPIIEDTEGVRVAPLVTPSAYPGLARARREAGLGETEEGLGTMWNQVDDFGWIKQVQSPNWGEIPVGERVQAPAPPPTSGVVGVGHDDDEDPDEI